MLKKCKPFRADRAAATCDANLRLLEALQAEHAALQTQSFAEAARADAGAKDAAVAASASAAAADLRWAAKCEARATSAELAATKVRDIYCETGIHRMSVTVSPVG